MPPRVAQRDVVEPLDGIDDVGQLEQPRACRDEETDAVLHWRDVADEVELFDPIEEAAVALHRRPRREGDERRVEGDASRVAARHGLLDVSDGVLLLEALEDQVVERLDGARDEHAAGRRQLVQQAGVTDEVLDLDRDVVAERGELACSSRTTRRAWVGR